MRRLANGDWYVRGHLPITDLADYGMQFELDSDAYNSVGGFVFSELGRLPKRGDIVRANGYSLRVESVRQNRVEAVRIRDHEPARRDASGRDGAARSNGAAAEGDQGEGGGERAGAAGGDQAAEGAEAPAAAAEHAGSEEGQSVREGG